MRTQRHPAARALLSCALVGLIGGSLIGCGVLDRGAVPLGPTVVTPSANPTETPTETPEPTPTETPSPSPSETPTSSPTPSDSPTQTERPSPRASTASPTPAPPPRVFPAGCQPGGNQSPRNSNPRAVPPPILDEEAELEAESQRGDGRSVFVEEVQLSIADALVVVCSLDNNRLLGWLRVPKSNFERSERVRLQDPITADSRLLVVLLADDSDGDLDWGTDRRVTDDDDDVDDLEVENLTYRYRG
jgi:hypothetical protein